MSKFKEGDRVEATVNCGNTYSKGWRGRILVVACNGSSIVQWDNGRESCCSFLKHSSSNQPITIFDLKEKGACESAINEFAERFGGKSVNGVSRERIIGRIRSVYKEGDAERGEYIEWLDKHFPVEQEKKKVMMYKGFYWSMSKTHLLATPYLVSKGLTDKKIIEWEEREFLI